MKNRELMLSEIDSNSGRYIDLPSHLQNFLRAWKYKGVLSPEIPVPEANPSIGFMIANVKVNESGEAKILEFGGLGSRLEGAIGGPNTVVEHLYRFVTSLKIPVTAITEQGIFDTLSGTDSVTRFTLGFNVPLAKNTFGIKFEHDIEKFSVEESGRVSPVQDIRNAKGIIWNHMLPDKAKNVDRAKYLVVNEDEVEAIINSKLATTKFFKEKRLEHLRPQSWVISSGTSSNELLEIILESEGIEKFVLKPTGLTNGRGVEVLHRDQLLERLSHLLENPNWIDDHEHPDYHLSGTLSMNRFLILEEYIESKPIEHDGEMYDATMRIVLMAVVNNAKLTVIPLSSHWELPISAMSSGWNTYSVVSGTVDEREKTAIVSDEDFQVAFERVAEAVSAIMKTANKTEHNALAPLKKNSPLPLEKHSRSGYRDEEAVIKPEVGKIYYIFSRKIRFLGMSVQSNGIEIFEVEYLDDPNPGDLDEEAKGEKKFYPYWQLKRLSIADDDL